MNAAVLTESIVLVIGTLLWSVVIVLTSLPRRTRLSVHGDPEPTRHANLSADCDADVSDDRRMPVGRLRSISNPTLRTKDHWDREAELTHPRLTGQPSVDRRLDQAERVASLSSPLPRSGT